MRPRMRWSLKVTLADPRREIDGADQESEDSGEYMRDEEMAVGDDLQTVGVVHGVIGDEKNFRGNEDKERGETKGNPENSFKSGTDWCWAQAAWKLP